MLQMLFCYPYNIIFALKQCKSTGAEFYIDTKFYYFDVFIGKKGIVCIKRTSEVAGIG